jgi:hypothetical protein
LPARKARSTRSRTPCGRSPWIGEGGEPAVGQVGAQRVALTLRPAEDDGQTAPFGLQQAGDHLRLVEVVRAEDVLRGQRHGVALVRLLGADLHRLAEEFARQRDDRSGHRRAEQHRLARRRRLRKQFLYVRQETEVEHLVRLVEHQHPDAAEVEMPLPGQVEQPARRTDDDVDAALESLDLRLVRAAAVNSVHAYVERLGRPL